MFVIRLSKPESCLLQIVSCSVILQNLTCVVKENWIWHKAEVLTQKTKKTCRNCGSCSLVNSPTEMILDSLRRWCGVRSPAEMIGCMKDWLLWRNIIARTNRHSTWQWWWWIRAGKLCQDSGVDVMWSSDPVSVRLNNGRKSHQITGLPRTRSCVSGIRFVTQCMKKIIYIYIHITKCSSSFNSDVIYAYHIDHVYSAVPTKHSSATHNKVNSFH